MQLRDVEDLRHLRDVSEETSLIHLNGDVSEIWKSALFEMSLRHWRDISEMHLRCIHADWDVASLCKKALQELNALTRAAQNMNLAQTRPIMKIFICSQFWYCTLIWMFHSRKMNNCINSLHERSLRVVYRDYNAKFFELLSKDKSVTINKS